VITKAGGLIVARLARGRPLVIIDPIPGQEEWNADYVVSAGAGIQLRLGAMVSEAVTHLLADVAHRELLAAGAARAGRPRAALDIASAVLADIERVHDWPRQPADGATSLSARPGWGDAVPPGPVGSPSPEMVPPRAARAGRPAPTDAGRDEP
jgi:hypothetical protein